MRCGSALAPLPNAASGCMAAARVAARRKKLAMEHSSILAILDRERRDPPYDGWRVEKQPHVTRVLALDGSHHTILHSSLNPENADAIIEQQIDHFRKLGVGFEWKLYSHDLPDNLLERLRSRGLQIDPPETVVVYDLKERPPWIGLDGIRVIRADRLEQVEVFRTTAEAISGRSWAFTANELSNDIRNGWNQHRGYIAFDRDEPVSIGRLYLHPRSEFGMLFGGATLASHRGKGFYRAVIAARARDAIEHGAKYLIVDAMATSRPILQRMGFVRITDTVPCNWKVQ